MATLTHKCDGCGNRTSAMGLCRTCKSAFFHAQKRIQNEGLLVDKAGGAWWVWSPKGEVLVIGQPDKYSAILALALGESLDEF